MGEAHQQRQEMGKDFAEVSRPVGASFYEAAEEAL
jgi:hypothetical protein